MTTVATLYLLSKFYAPRGSHRIKNAGATPESLMSDVMLSWLTTSDHLLISIQEKIKWADSMSELDKKHKKEVEERVEEVKKSLSLKADVDFRGHEEIYSGPGGVMDYEEDRIRPKR
ncbi:proteasome component (PCI) domain protein [Actinidia rufa]|uniref:Proteasome component (PCI) domain protein n=1 Tax=Actinidia rufa TaxID=165716 RepID=A0A7J0F3B6_9ERIC|nr:proteasome component (PCI) domain protein [Actinidia rufa]